MIESTRCQLSGWVAGGSLWVAVSTCGQTLIDDISLTGANESITIPVILNDIAVEGDEWTLHDFTQAVQGTVTNKPDGTLTYTPPLGFAGRDTFSYRMTDGTNVVGPATVAVVVSALLDPEAVRDQLLAGVSTLSNPTQPSFLVAYGPQTCHVMNYTTDPAQGGMAAAAHWGHGKVVALPDHQWLNMDQFADDASTMTFYRNSLAWLTGSTSLAIRVVTYDQGIVDTLTTEGYTQVTKTDEVGLLAALSNADVLVPGWLGSSEPQANLDGIAEFVRQGGGLFLVEYGVGYNWWWGLPIPEAPGNRLLRGAGIGFAAGNRWEGDPYDATHRATGQLGASDVLQILDGTGSYTQIQTAEGSAMLGRMFDFLPSNDTLLAELDVSFQTRINQINPTPTTPVTDPLEQALLLREAAILETTPAAEVTEHRTAETIYGSIPTNALRVTRNVTLDTNIARWQPTGLYAVPGEVITLTVPTTLVGQGYLVRVNAHRDSIQRRSIWERPPKVHRTFPIDATTLDVANGFGGAIFIDFRGNAFSTPPALGPIDITIAGAIEHPMFVLGRDTDIAWNTSLRRQPGPYSVLVGDNLICVLPTHQIESADLTEPTALMTWWDQVVELQDELANRIEPRISPELINVDVQQSAGAAHAGYPIQAYEKHWGNLADLGRLRERGSWGDFHELGHNHQRGWWTFNGDTEVTVNIFSSYTLRQHVSAPSSGGWGWTVDPVVVINRATQAVAASDTYSGLSSLADRLAFWVQLADGFGWNTYKQVFRAYEEDLASDPTLLPGTDQEEKDQWLVRFSQLVGYDMSQFMVDTWGLEVSSNAVSSVSSLPDWMPVIGGVPDMTIPPGHTRVIDIQSQSFSMDGTAVITEVTSPEHGEFVNQGSGIWAYTANPYHRGPDSFTYTLQSSAGNTQTFTNHIEVSSQGALLETWLGLSGTAIADLTASPNYPDLPDEVMVLSDLEAPNNRGGDFGARLSAILIPPTDGDYTFWIASDDNGELRLSTSEDPALAVLIADVPNWTSSRQWNKFPTNQESASISLLGGERYYIEALMKEAGGGDNVAVAWAGPGISGPSVISGNYLNLPGIVPLTPAQEWARSHNLSNESVLESADPDGDGVINLLEFAVGGNPALADASLARIKGAVYHDETNAIPRLWHRRRSDFEQQGLTYSLEYTTDYVTWATANMMLVKQIQPEGNDLETITLQQASPDEEPMKIFRLQVTGP